MPWEVTDSQHRPERPWIVYRSTAYGYSKMQANATTLVMYAYGNRRNLIHDTLVLRK
jgi:hypothetical protein